MTQMAASISIKNGVKIFSFVVCFWLAQVMSVDSAHHQFG
jgi:hypothetical protein